MASKGVSNGMILPQYQRCPLAKLRNFDGINTIADRDDGVERVEFELRLLSFTFDGSMLSGYFYFGNNHFFLF